MVDFTTQELAKLPVWAQHKVRTMEANFRRLEQEIAAFTGRDETAIELEPYATNYGKLAKFVPEGMDIGIAIPGGKLHVRLRGELVEIMGQSLGMADMYVRPNCSNVVHIGFKDFSK